ncbi:MAG TPA: Rne/Rng family ribonuclease, partial [Terriglobales bacterium]|nr:Rne/Rng family ribonuclease [Terriglobales bacterium]
MTKELFVSSTPHETRVGMVEDDQLAEIYLERENEYTLAGSIYKGRVTRVLPGMQSAFVDIGLERDAFLYVSDFMELGEDQDDVEEVPTNRPAQAYQAPPRAESEPEVPVGNGGSEQPAQVSASETHVSRENGSSTPSQPQENRPSEDRGSWRGRRRRRGRGRDRFPDSKYARPGSDTPREPQRAEYGPPAGYQPIILPGESISKYQRLAQNPPPPRAEEPTLQAQETPLAQIFPEDEPLFANPATDENSIHQEQHEPAGAHAANFDVNSLEWDREQKRRHEMNAAAVFGGQEQENSEEDDRTSASEHVAGSPRTLEEEEIEEEEADLAHYVEELEEDAAFEEMEEETHAADEYGEHAQIAASGDAVTEEIPFSAEPVAAEAAEVAEVEGVDEEAEEEAELEEAQAEAEAVVEAEARANGTADARAEVRAPAATAPYTQRAPRPAYDRHGPRGRRGGRRFRRREPQNVPLITDLLKEGQEILVQIAKEPIGKKGARITSHIALPGRFLVCMPTVNHTGVSRKISSEDERLRLKRIINSERENGHGGFIVRTAAQGAAEEDLRADIRFLKGLWFEIRTRAENSKPPALIYHDLSVVERVLRDQVTSDFSAIWVDTEQEYERILRFANRFQPALVKRVKLYTKEIPLFEQFGLNEEINKALRSKVWLKSGGYIVINQTEALVAIDVNTGKYVGKTAWLEDTIVKTNVDAIKEIVRQIRLRDLGGIIVIDFIDMDERRNRQKVMQALEEALRADRAPSKVLQFNDFGLVAITRKRVKQSLERTIGTPCPYCQSTGFVKSVTTVCNEIYLEMRKIA